jgi:hypothetical protein
MRKYSHRVVEFSNLRYLLSGLEVVFYYILTDYSKCNWPFRTARGQATASVSFGPAILNAA